jgi:ribosomal 50S subunit-recycling heat shock protein
VTPTAERRTPSPDRSPLLPTADHDAMRLDKFLQVSRLVKRRTLADALCSNHRVRVNDRIAKASTAVRAGDVLEIDFGGRTVTARVLSVPQRPPRRSEADALTEVVVRDPW